MAGTGVIEVDLHGLRADEALAAIERAIRRAPASAYRIRLIHGFHGGTRLREMIRYEYGTGLEPMIKRVEMGSNEGITELVLREY